MKSCAVGTSPVNLCLVASHYLTSSVLKRLSVQGQSNLFLWSFTWMLCLGIVVSPCINLYYTNSLQPQWSKAKLIFILCIYHHSERTHLKRSCENFQQVWWGFGCCEPSMGLCFSVLNLNGVCQLGIIPFGMILRMEVKVNFCWKVLWEQRSKLCICPCMRFSLVDQKMCWCVRAMLCSQLSLMHQFLLSDKLVWVQVGFFFRGRW